jgi:hypothetical protein
MNISKEFGYILEELRKQLFDADKYFDIFEQLWPTPEAVDTINRYRGFFIPVRQALFDQFTIKICNVTGNDRRLPSFHNIFKMLILDPSLAPGIDVRSLRRRLKQLKPILDAIYDYRNTKAAHWDIEMKGNSKPILYGQTRKMLKELENIFNKISSVGPKKSWSFQYVQHRDATALVRHLDELRTVHKKQIDELMTQTRSQ